MKGMTNALPVLIDASTLATKSDISDMETKTNANATFATKTALTNLQNSVGDAFSQVAVGSDGKSLDFTALDGQVNNVVLPTGSSDFTKLSSLTNIDISKIKVGTQIIVCTKYVLNQQTQTLTATMFSGTCYIVPSNNTCNFLGSGMSHTYGGAVNKYEDFGNYLQFNTDETYTLKYYFISLSKSAIYSQDIDSSNIESIYVKY